MPPSCAIAIASLASVTVSIADDRRGILRRTPLVSCAETSVCPGMTSDGPGTSKTSSKVSAIAVSSADRLEVMPTSPDFGGRHVQAPWGGTLSRGLYHQGLAVGSVLSRVKWECW